MIIAKLTLIYKTGEVTDGVQEMINSAKVPLIYCEEEKQITIDFGCQRQLNCLGIQDSFASNILESRLEGAKDEMPYVRAQHLSLGPLKDMKLIIQNLILHQVE